MAENSNIEWTNHTFNPWRGCTKVSDGCAHCYAEKGSKRNPKVLGIWGPNGTRPIAAEAYWRKPLKWNREAVAAGERRRVFCASLADVFEDREDLVAPRDRLFDLILATPQLDWLILTKRPEMMREYFGWSFDARTGHPWCDGWPNVWLGVSVEDQEWADKRIPVLLDVPARHHFLSAEPLLGPLDVSNWLGQEPHRVDWVIAGGESGGESRPPQPEWVRSVRDQCQAARVAFFFKQWGESAPLSQLTTVHSRFDEAGTTMVRLGKKNAGRLLDGREWSEFPLTKS